MVFNKETQPEAHAKAEQARSEFVVAVEGKVTLRGKANPELATGEAEIVAARLHILNNAKTPPFRLKMRLTRRRRRGYFRYLDLRRPKPHRNLALRHKILLEIRQTMDEMGFDRGGDADADALHAGGRARLPGAEPRTSREFLRAAAIAADFPTDFDDWRAGTVFRDCEVFPRRGLRADRQPELTQLDLEMSFRGKKTFQCD